MRTIALALIFAGAAVAAPAAASALSRPYPVKVEDLFSLVSKVTKQRTSGAPLALENYYLASAHFGAGEDALLFVSGAGKSATNTFNLTADRYVQNGTTEQLEYGNGYVERYPPTPGQGEYGVYGVTVEPTGQTNDAGRHFVGTFVGSGSPGVGIRYPYTGIAFPESQPKLGYRNETVPTYTSQFLACETVLYGQTVPTLYWRSENGTTPADCAEVTLFAQCAGNATQDIAALYHTVQKTPCYPDAAAIPVVQP